MRSKIVNSEESLDVSSKVWTPEIDPRFRLVISVSTKAAVICVV